MTEALRYCTATGCASVLFGAISGLAKKIGIGQAWAGQRIGQEDWDWAGLGMGRIGDRIGIGLAQFALCCTTRGWRRRQPWRTNEKKLGEFRVMMFVVFDVKLGLIRGIDPCQALFWICFLDHVWNPKLGIEIAKLGIEIAVALIDSSHMGGLQAAGRGGRDYGGHEGRPS